MLRSILLQNSDIVSKKHHVGIPSDTQLNQFSEEASPSLLFRQSAMSTCQFHPCLPFLFYSAAESICHSSNTSSFLRSPSWISLAQKQVFHDRHRCLVHDTADSFFQRIITNILLLNFFAKILLSIRFQTRTCVSCPMLRVLLMISIIAENPCVLGICMSVRSSFEGRINIPMHRLWLFGPVRLQCMIYEYLADLDWDRVQSQCIFFLQSSKFCYFHSWFDFLALSQLFEISIFRFRMLQIFF